MGTMCHLNVLLSCLEVYKMYYIIGHIEYVRTKENYRRIRVNLTS